MEFSRHGAMAQLVVVTAIQKYTDQVLQRTLEGFIEEESGKDGFAFINPKAWYLTCQEIREKMEKSYG